MNVLESPSVKKRVPLPFDIKDWLKQPGKLVTRQELWEFVNRLEVGRRVRNRPSRKLKRTLRRLWGWLTRQAIELEDPYYR